MGDIIVKLCIKDATEIKYEGNHVRIKSSTPSGGWVERSYENEIFLGVEPFASDIITFGGKNG